ncbi:MAG: hypothetical protein AAFO91_15485, partial [Bacteroidota bacterium]
FLAKQANQESAKSFIHRCQQLAIDCGFKCPKCRKNLTDLVLVQRVTSGLSNIGLKQEIMKDHEQFDSVQKLLKKCEIYESAEKDSLGEHDRAQIAVVNYDGDEDIGAVVMDDENPPIVAGNKSTYKQRERGHAWGTGSARKLNVHCENCGLSNHGKRKCPAEELECHKCGVTGHFRSQCPQKTKNSKPPVKSVTSCTVAGTPAEVRRVCASGSKAMVQVEISHFRKPKGLKLNALADTGAEVCLVGVKKLGVLGLRRRDLSRCNVSVRHAGEELMENYGEFEVTIKLGGNTAKSTVVVVEGASRFYLSLDVCKALGLVDPNFPNHVTPVRCDVITTNKGVPTQDPRQTSKEDTQNKRCMELPYAATE